MPTDTSLIGNLKCQWDNAQWKWQPLSSTQLSHWLLYIVALVTLYINHLHSYFVSCTVHIIIMYLDPSVSINCKYKTLNNIQLDSLTDMKWHIASHCSRILLIAGPICLGTNTSEWCLVVRAVGSAFIILCWVQVYKIRENVQVRGFMLGECGHDRYSPSKPCGRTSVASVPCSLTACWRPWHLAPIHPFYWQKNSKKGFRLIVTYVPK